MARDFSSSSFSSSIDFSAYNVLTIALWINPDTWAGAGGYNMLYELTGDAFTVEGGFALYNAADQGGLTMAMRSSSRFPFVRPSTGVWTSLIAQFDLTVETSTLELRLWQNGVEDNSPTDTTNDGPAFDTSFRADEVMYVGRRTNSTLAFDGKMAEGAIYNGTLNADQKTALALGFSPLLIKPSSLIHYWPMLGRATDEEDWVGSPPLTNVGGVTASPHPRVIYAQRLRTFLPSVAANQTFYIDPLMFGAGL